jgi:hypothetical protein
MKYFFTVLVLLTLSVTANAQISFTADEYFAFFNQSSVTGTSYSSTDLTGLDALIAKSGASQSWDFGNRVYTQDPPAAATQTLLTYPGGAALASDPDFASSTHVLKTVPNDPTQPTIYIFIKYDQTGYWWLGSSEDSLGVATKVFGYAPPQQQLKFPLTFGTSWQSTSNVHSPLFPEGSGTTYAIAYEGSVDAYGTLITPTSAHKQENSPMASSDALRLKSKQTTTLTFQIPMVGTFITTSVTYNFQFLTKNGHSADIGADTNVKPTSVSYSAPNGGSAVYDNYPSAENLLNLYFSANPASNSETKLSFTTKQSGNVAVSVMDALGKEVRMLHNGPAQAGQNIIAIDPTKFAAGTYFIRVNVNGLAATRKLIITK